MRCMKIKNYLEKPLFIHQNGNNPNLLQHTLLSRMKKNKELHILLLGMQNGENLASSVKRIYHLPFGEQFTFKDMSLCSGIKFENACAKIIHGSAIEWKQCKYPEMGQ